LSLFDGSGGRVSIQFHSHTEQFQLFWLRLRNRKTMSIVLKRAYEKPASKDGYRVLVDRVWPRGVSKDEAKLDEWVKEAAPSDKLRKWFHDDPSRWGEFRKQFLSELKDHKDQLRSLAQRAKKGRATLVFGARDEKHNNAVVLKQYLKMLGAR
jgi:uncharacterized protein YeaO (DUF488 family)